MKILASRLYELELRKRNEERAHEFWLGPNQAERRQSYGGNRGTPMPPFGRHRNTPPRGHDQLAPAQLSFHRAGMVVDGARGLVPEASLETRMTELSLHPRSFAQ